MFASALPGVARAAGGDDFYFVQLSDTHWGFEGPPNPDAEGTLRKAVAAVNALEQQPDFIVFTGDLTHTTDDPEERREAHGASSARSSSACKVKNVRFMPGEHDASLDNGEAFKEFFGATHYTLRPQGRALHRARQRLRPAARDRRRAARLARGRPRSSRKDAPHRRAHAPAAVRPGAAMGLGDARRRQGDRAADAATRTSTVFYGHIHQEHHHMTGHIAHHCGEVADLPAARAGLAAQARADAVGCRRSPISGLGFREVEAEVSPRPTTAITEYPVIRST